MSNPSSNVIAYDLTDAAGNYVLQADSTGAYQIKVTYLGYRPVSRDVIYDGAAVRSIKVNVSMAPSENSTQTVTITAERPPIIVQGDTTTFNVDQWAEVDDEDLEAVLKKMPGFSVAKDGSLNYRGKKIEKILIDGEEVANVGAALLTRGISAQSVKSVQVRQRDQDARLKESLLDDDGVMVLDIELKEGLKNSTFGRLRAGAGVSPYARPLGYGSVFRIRKNSRMHILTEYDPYGNPKIAIEEIKNLGREAYADIFNTPADFSRLQQRTEYDRQVYGFNQFQEVEDATLAFSLNTDINDDIRLFAGSYHNLDASAISQFDRQRLFLSDAPPEEFSSSTVEEQRQFDSRNKLELDFSRDSLKIRYNINGLFAADRPQQAATYSETSSIGFSSERRNFSLYQNFNLSKLFSRGGFALSAYQSFGYDRNQRNFYSSGFPNLFPFDNTIYEDVRLAQNDTEKENLLIVDATIRYPLVASLPITFGYRYLRKGMEGEREISGEQRPADPAARLFTGNDELLLLRSQTPYLSFRFPISPFSIRGKVGYNFYQYPVAGTPTDTEQRGLLEYNLDAEFNSDAWIVLASYKLQAAAFPLAALRSGYTFSRFNMLNIPTRRDLELRSERTMQIAVNSYALETIGVGITGALAYGQTRSSPALFVNEDNPVAIREFAQNPSTYWLGSLKEAKIFESSSLTLSFEQSYIQFEQTNSRPRTEEGKYESAFGVLNLVSTAAVQSKDRNFNFSVGYKYSRYRFSNDLSSNISSQNQHESNGAANYKLFNNQLRLGVDVKSVWLQETSSTTNFNLVNFNASYSLPKGLLRLRADNIFDVRRFERRTIDPIQFNVQQRSIFGRVLFVSYQFDI